MPHLNASSQLWARFEEDMQLGFGLPILASDLRDLAAAATRAAEECMAEWTRAEAATRGTPTVEVE